MFTRTKRRCILTLERLFEGDVMKRYDIATRVLVDFEPGIGAKPAFFICASGTRAKVDRIIKKDEAHLRTSSFYVLFLVRSVVKFILKTIFLHIRTYCLWCDSIIFIPLRHFYEFRFFTKFLCDNIQNIHK